MKKLVIVGYNPLSQKTNIILGVDKLVDFTQVEYWDVSPLIGNQGYPVKADISSVHNIEINDYHQFEINVERLDSNTFVVFNMYVKSDTYFFYKLISKKECKIAAVVSGTLPSFSRKTKDYSIIGQLVHKLKASHKIEKTVDLLKNRLFAFKLKKLRPFDYYLYSGSKASFVGYLPSEKTVRVPINSYDFQISRSSNKHRVIAERFVLFIDEYLPFHPDMEMLGMNIVSPEIYYKELNSFFDLIEKRYGFSVVISAHPRADKYHKCDYFNGRQVIWGETNSLSYFSEFVITHYSTAIIFPICYKKPIIFIYSDEMERNDPSFPVVFSMADILRCNYVNTSHAIDTNVYPVDEMRYNDYLYSYATSPTSENFDNSQIVLNLLK